MITGFGNNISSALASDITANQTAIRLVPGGGALFSKILTKDISNPSSPHGVYAKLTITDSQQTVFEICHLTAVSNDTLTVIRGQEGTSAKGWALNDVVGNFATRGSEESFVQIEQLQGGDYTSATAGGTPNALAISLPSTFGNNNSNDWQLKTPLLVTPIAANSGNTTLQLTFGGKVIGTFPLFKGNKAQLDAGDIIPNVPFICLLDSTKAFFTIVNPINLYSKLGSAAFRDAQTSKTDATAGRLMQVAAFGLGGYGTDNPLIAADTKKPLRNGFYNVSGDPAYGNGALLSWGYDSGSQVHLIVKQGGTTPVMGICSSTPAGVFGEWGKIYTEFQKPTAADVGAVPLARKVNGHALSADVNVTSQDIFNGQAIGLTADIDLNTLTTPGLYYNPANANATPAKNYPSTNAGSLMVLKDAGSTQIYTEYNSGRQYRRGFYVGVWTAWFGVFDTRFKPSAGDVGALPLGGGTLSGILRANADGGALMLKPVTAGASSYLISQDSAGANNWYIGYGSNDNTTLSVSNYKTGAAITLASVVTINKQLNVTGAVIPTLYTNFDARYQAKGNYTPAGEAYTKAQSDAGYMPKTSAYTKVESDGRFQPKGSYAPAGEAYTKAVSDTRFQPKGSYTPAGEAYTKAVSDGRYLNGMRWTAEGGANNNNQDYTFATAPHGAAITGVLMKGNYIAVTYRYLQMKTNSGVWVTLGYS